MLENHIFCKLKLELAIGLNIFRQGETTSDFMLLQMCTQIDFMRLKRLKETPGNSKRLKVTCRDP